MTVFPCGFLRSCTPRKSSRCLGAPRSGQARPSFLLPAQGRGEVAEGGGQEALLSEPRLS